MGRGQRSNLNYTDVYGSSYSMANNSNLNPHFFDINLAYKNFSFLFIYDNYLTTNADGYINALSKAYPCNFLSYMSEIKYNKQLNKKLQFQAKFNYKRSVPWTFDGQPAFVDSSYGYYKILADRYRLNFMVTWNAMYWLDANFGLEGIYDEAYKPNGQLFKFDSSDRVHYFNYAPFLEVGKDV